MDLTHFKYFQRDQKLIRRIGEILPEWKKTYHTINVEEQIMYAHTWLVTTGKCHVYKDMSRFLNSWFRTAVRIQNERGGRPVVSKPYVEDKPKLEDVMDEQDWKKLREAIKK